MRKFLGRLAVVMTVVVVAGLVDAGEPGETKVPLDKVPKAVLDAVKAKFPKAKLVGAAKEKGEEKDKFVYEITIKNEGHNTDVTVSPEGKILLVEKEIPAKDLPKVVAEGLETKYPKSKINLAEEISKDDKIIKYEMRITTADKKELEVTFDPMGKFLTEEKIAKAEKKADSKEEKKESKQQSLLQCDRRVAQLSAIGGTYGRSYSTH